MTLDKLTFGLWLTVILSKWILTVLLVHRRAWKHYPRFFLFSAFYSVLSTTLFLVQKVLGYDAYFYTYWVGVFCVSVLTALALQEVLADLFRPFAAVPVSELKTFFLVAITLAVLFAACSIGNPSDYSSRLMSFCRTMDRTLAAMLVFSLLAITWLARILRISWRRRTAAIAFGFGLYLSVDLVTTITAISATPQLNTYLRILPMLAYLLAGAAWIRGWLLPERELKSLSPVEQDHVRTLLVKASIAFRNTKKYTTSCDLPFSYSRRRIEGE